MCVSACVFLRVLFIASDNQPNLLRPPYQALLGMLVQQETKLAALERELSSLQQLLASLPSHSRTSAKLSASSQVYDAGRLCSCPRAVASAQGICRNASRVHLLPGFLIYPDRLRSMCRRARALLSHTWRAGNVAAMPNDIRERWLCSTRVCALFDLARVPDPSS